MSDETQGSVTDAGQRQDVEKLRERCDQLEIMFATIQDVTSTLSVREVLGRLLDRTLKHLNSEIGSILLVEPTGNLRIAIARGLPDEVVTHTRIHAGEGISGYVATTGSSLLIDDIEDDPRFQRRNHERYYTSSLLSSPIILQGAVRGIINVNNKRNHDPFDQDDCRLLEALASHAAVALSNAQSYEEMLERAQHDALTGLANHGHFWSMIEVEMARAERYSRQVSLVMVDVDHFKAFNDRVGHMGGDEALSQTGALILARSRASDLAARYGGEEFAVILPETSLLGAVSFSEKIRASIELEAFGPDGDDQLTVSLGVATFPEDGTTPRTLVEAADRRLYLAKSAGRNQACCEN